MATINIENMDADAIKTIAVAFGQEEQFDIAGESLGFEVEGLTGTDTTIAEWISARGTPTRDGNLYVFDSRRAVARSGKPGRMTLVGPLVLVLEIPGGTVAEISNH
jgi:hypothetical protein